MKLRPCPKCKRTNIETRACGYNTFNPGAAWCKGCGHEVTVPHCESKDDPCIVRAWNKVPVDEKLKLERLKTRRLRQQLREAGLDPVA